MPQLKDRRPALRRRPWSANPEPIVPLRLSMTFADAGALETGVMVALFPDQPDLLAIEGGEPADQLHITLAYLGEAVEWSEDQRSALHAAVAAVAAEYGPLNLTVAGVAEFNGGTDEACAVLLVEGEGLVELHEALWSAIGDVIADGPVVPEPHPVFIPHLTEGYGLDPSTLDALAGVEFSASEMGVSFAGEVGMHALGQEADAVEATEPEELAAEAPVASFEMDPGGRHFRACLIVEGVESGDGRFIREGALTWREPPLPFMFMFRNPDGGAGHDAAEAVGHIDRMWRNEDDPRFIWGEGDFDENAIADRAIEMVDSGTVRGVSADLDMLEVEWENDEPGESEDLLEWDPGLMIVVKGRVMGATGCGFPAFAECTVELVDDTELAAVETPADAPAEAAEAELVTVGDSVTVTQPDIEPWTGVVVAIDADAGTVTVEPDDGSGTVVVDLAEVVVTEPMAEAAADTITLTDSNSEAIAMIASAGNFQPLGAIRARVYTPYGQALVASAGPVHPPAAWFELPPLREIHPVRVSPEGRISGYVAEWGSEHIGLPGRKPPRDGSNYAKFRTGQTMTAEGSLVATGRIVADTVHPDLAMIASDTSAFYAETGCALADVVPFEDGVGIYVVGAVRPGVTAEQLRILRGSDVSPDWRPVNGRLECVGMLCVNTSGFIVNGLVASAARRVVTDIVLCPRERFNADGEITALVAAGMVSRSTKTSRSLAARVKSLETELATLRAAVAPYREERAMAALERFARKADEEEEDDRKRRRRYEVNFPATSGALP